MNPQNARKFFPIVENQIYLNHAACSPMSTEVKNAIEKFLHLRNAEKADDFKTDLLEAKNLRATIAELLNTSPHRIALTSNTTQGLNIFASGLQWKEGDEILLSKMEFPSNVYPFLNLQKKGVKIRWMPEEDGRIPLEYITTFVNDKTKLLSLSYVQYLNGYKADLQAIGKFCKENNIIFILDGIQALGAFQIDLEKTHIDGIATGGHKWLMSPKGTGFVYVSENLQGQISQSHLGWLSVENPFEFHNYNQSLDETAQRYELATPNQIGIYGMNAAITLLLEVGIANISKHLTGITGFLREELESSGY
ncbi:MAG: aminotransferase class V-fold PLP-dependent enzyme, partial [Candidatus Marinimicrobia bacterium]|nr:aminotransferase class V-fold PLP-dependent enzyme [Candidatus Neomarinimicrobiota bacterium]